MISQLSSFLLNLVYSFLNNIFKLRSIVFVLHSLGSTRFFKVARARSQEGLIVVKVFVIHDPTLALSTYKDKLEEIRSKLASAVNCLPFQRMIVSISLERY